ncbi:MAG: hypothetical protein GX859_11155 [Corynebacterium humireducens]|jgi:hypothetical protein|uniref:DUF4303 domain-containing protein n=1 Tax=Corynebacterium humireducens TaxID=1223514 RepID=A0A7X6PQD0_9CORY|nr:hypothetical protein [Corynebacterium humireducens]
MTDFTRLDAAISTTLREGVAELLAADPTLTLMACGVVEDLTGFYVAGAGAEWLAEAQSGGEEDLAALWYPSEWPLEAEHPEDVPPGRVTSAIWELSGCQASGTGDVIDDDAYAALTRDYEERIVLALRELREEGVLRNGSGEQILVWLHSSDESAPDLDARTFAALQEPALAALFRDRFGDGGRVLVERILGP